MMRRLHPRSCIALACAMSALKACTLEGWARAPEPGLERMFHQPRVDAFEEVSRPLPEGVLALRREEPPPPMSLAFLLRGRERFEVHCSPCHGVDGRSETTVADDMEFRRPQPLVADRVRALSDDDILRTIRDGYGMMPSYAHALDASDRRAVVAYVRALQVRDAGVMLSALSPSLRAAAERDLEDPDSPEIRP